jgi:hypothetical protein
MSVNLEKFPSTPQPGLSFIGDEQGMVSADAQRSGWITRMWQVYASFALHEFHNKGSDAIGGKGSIQRLDISVRPGMTF